MKDQSSPDESSTYFQYWDANNIYGFVITQKLLLRNVWKTSDDFALEKIGELVKKGKLRV